MVLFGFRDFETLNAAHLFQFRVCCDATKSARILHEVGML